MKISTKGRYGLRAMIDLAINSAGDHVSLNSIAERQNVSENYLEQVFSTLRKAGLVKSIKGAQGGYVLSDRASNITVGDVLRALEGNLSVIDDASEAKSGSKSMEQCLSKNVWERINESVNSIVDSISVEDLVNEYKKLNGNLELMFYI
jgi:Rrf2 family transcriptional regulator, cysteine metabolism repressor